jgi:hypothetical protein
MHRVWEDDSGSMKRLVAKPSRFAKAVLLVRLGQPRMGRGKKESCQGHPNFLAVQKVAGIVMDRFVADEILKSRFSHVLTGFSDCMRNR